MYKAVKGNFIIKKTVMIVTILSIVAISILLFQHFTIEKLASTTPDYPKLNLTEICKKDNLTDKDYQMILMQTGLGKPAIDKLRKSYVSEIGLNKGIMNHDDLNQILNTYQNNFFEKHEYKCNKIGVITHEERITNKKGKLVTAFDIADIQNGDVILSRSTHSIGWRHGHAAIVTDTTKGEALEATLWGCPTEIKNIKSWQSYSSFVLLRPKQGINGEGASQFALKNLNNLSYGLLTGIPTKGPDKIKKTQCAHLVWYTYFKLGYDIDSDGGWLVTPKDIARSDLFDVVQVYGVNPEDIWP